ncbi:hypothetical protein [Rhodococcus rhodochrous]|uniref:hypothetical protein n=1 Tax=Rhodococcus rhodochrous TaxID=1829 RepID=UPI0012FD9FAA|nr:hypothetical protein [Rhodococcus rhodochrous]
MRIVISPGTISADDADNLTTLEVTLRDVTSEQASEVLQGAGRLEGGYAWLTVETLRKLAPHPRGADWDTRFENMIAYARSKGWMNENCDTVRAHVL